MKIGEFELNLYGNRIFWAALEDIKKPRNVKEFLISHSNLEIEHYVLGLYGLELDRFPPGVQLANYFPLLFENLLANMGKNWGHILLTALELAVERFRKIGKPAFIYNGYMLHPIYGIKTRMLYFGKMAIENIPLEQFTKVRSECGSIFLIIDSIIWLAQITSEKDFYDFMVILDVSTREWRTKYPGQGGRNRINWDDINILLEKARQLGWDI